MYDPESEKVGTACKIEIKLKTVTSKTMFYLYYIENNTTSYHLMCSSLIFYFFFQNKRTFQFWFLQEI